MLRFGENFILNIELKSELKVANKTDKIEKQLKTNYLCYFSSEKTIITFSEMRTHSSSAIPFFESRQHLMEHQIHCRVQLLVVDS